MWRENRNNTETTAAKILFFQGVDAEHFNELSVKLGKNERGQKNFLVIVCLHSFPFVRRRRENLR